MTNAQLHGCTFDGWQCFHCGEIFTTVGGARDHFGGNPEAKPGCLLKVELGGERGLLMALRQREEEIDALRYQLKEAAQRLAEANHQLTGAMHLIGRIVSTIPVRKVLEAAKSDTTVVKYFKDLHKQAEGSRVPTGWCLVPIEPAKEMMEAPQALPALRQEDLPLARLGWTPNAICNRQRWQAMLAKTPLPPTGE